MYCFVIYSLTASVFMDSCEIIAFYYMAALLDRVYHFLSCCIASRRRRKLLHFACRLVSNNDISHIFHPLSVENLHLKQTIICDPPPYIMDFVTIFYYFLAFFASISETKSLISLIPRLSSGGIKISLSLIKSSVITLVYTDLIRDTSSFSSASSNSYTLS